MPSVRLELLKAREHVRRQIEILQSPAAIDPAMGGPPDNRRLILELEGVLREIEDSLAGLDDAA